MQAFRQTIPPTIFETFPRVSRAATQTIINSTQQSSRQFQSAPRKMSNNLSFQAYKITNTSFPSAPGVNLSDAQRVLTGSILDLFAGQPSLRKLSLWKDDATFTDPITIAEGRKQFAPQWYGLPAAFSKIERLGGQVISDGNPIELELKTKYTVKGLGSEHTIDSKVKIFTEGQGDNIRIKRVEDRWDDSLKEGTFRDAMKNLNSVIVPTLVSVPKSIEEEEKSQ